MNASWAEPAAKRILAFVFRCIPADERQLGVAHPCRDALLAGSRRLARYRAGSRTCRSVLPSAVTETVVLARCSVLNITGE